MSVVNEIQRVRRRNHKPDTPILKEKKREAEKVKNTLYYSNRGAFIHKIHYLKKRYQLPSEFSTPENNVKDLSIGNIRTLFYKIREYVDDLKAKERKEKASHSRKPTEI